MRITILLKVDELIFDEGGFGGIVYVQWPKANAIGVDYELDWSL